MLLRYSFIAFAITTSNYIPSVHGWGAAGHEIVATIAQIYIAPTALTNICTILNFTSTNPDEPQCHLAPVSTWADRYKYKMRWSAPLHYVGAVDDYPSRQCSFPGERGWAGQKAVNVLSAIRNVTGILEEWDGEESVAANEALKFLIHFMGDLHMPLHLTGRDRGGNSIKVHFDRRQTNLHSLWDGLLIAKAIRTVPRNYSRPLPYPAVEKVLRGTIYDSYIRRIMWEGLINQWANDTKEWLSCPSIESQAQESQSTWQYILSGFKRATGNAVASETDDDILCPYHWAKPIHQLNCKIVFPKELDEPPYKHMVKARPRPIYLELDTPQYSGIIAKEMMIEKLLVQAGLRLAGTLNWLFADTDEAGVGALRGIENV